jgi:hypothetical protein
MFRCIARYAHKKLSFGNRIKISFLPKWCHTDLSANTLGWVPKIRWKASTHVWYYYCQHNLFFM